MTARRTGAPYPLGGHRRAIISGLRCGWPDRCTDPDSWHAPRPGERRSWGYHDVQCQRPSADPGRYPGCTLTDLHTGTCHYLTRACQVRSADRAYWPECTLINGHTPPCHYKTLAEINLVRASNGLRAIRVPA